MPHFGNDVVDLKEAANAGKSGDSRFLKKILTDAEIGFVRNAENHDLALWSLWACKETAYKVTIKKSPGARFLPRRWQTLMDDSPFEISDGKVVAGENCPVFIRLFANSEYIHCVGSDHQDLLDTLIWTVESLPDEETEPSVFARQCLVRSLEESLSLNGQLIKIERTEKNGQLAPPRVYIGGDQTDLDVSLSHDGRFVAYAFREFHAHDSNPPALRSGDSSTNSSNFAKLVLRESH